jgi:hypothetical protein
MHRFPPPRDEKQYYFRNMPPTRLQPLPSDFSSQVVILAEQFLGDNASFYKGVCRGRAQACDSILSVTLVDFTGIITMPSIISIYGRLI